MQLIDLTLPVQEEQNGKRTACLEEWAIGQGDRAYTGMVYSFSHDSMVGTYLDFPGHIKETDDGLDAASYPLEKLYRLDAAVIHLNRIDGSGGIGADELAGACPGPVSGGALIVNALGGLRFDEIEERSVFLKADAVGWIIDTGVHLLVSDVYESPELHGVFPDLFKSGVSTVCYAVNLDQLTTPRVRLTVLAVRFPNVTQLPCRVVAEVEVM